MIWHEGFTYQKTLLKLDWVWRVCVQSLWEEQKAEINKNKKCTHKSVLIGNQCTIQKLQLFLKFWEKLVLGNYSIHFVKGSIWWYQGDQGNCGKLRKSYFSFSEVMATESNKFSLGSFEKRKKVLVNTNQWNFVSFKYIFCTWVQKIAPKLVTELQSLITVQVWRSKI